LTDLFTITLSPICVRMQKLLWGWLS